MDELRSRASSVHNHLIDELVAGRLSRRAFVRRATAIGISLPTIAAVLSACGSDSGSGGTGSGATTAASAGTPRAGGTLRVSVATPNEVIEPPRVLAYGSLQVLSAAGDYLAWSSSEGLSPRLAERWEPNDDASEWTFTIRQGVTFHDGSPMTTADVAATFVRLVTDRQASQAQTLFSGVLTKDGIEAVDDTVVRFTLERPHGTFANLVSSDNYGSIILPARYSEGWERDFIGTGAWRMASYDAASGVTFERNADYWDPDRQPLADRLELRFFDTSSAAINALISDAVDVVAEFAMADGEALANNPDIRIVARRGAAYRGVHLNNGPVGGPFQDKRVRRALGLALDRPAIIEGLLGGKAELGNESPFAPMFKSSDAGVAQRELDLEQAKGLVAEAGVASGTTVDIYGVNHFEDPSLAAVLKDAAAELGITLKLNMVSENTYYAKYWLDSPMGITDYGSFGTPAIGLIGSYRSTGGYNAAHFDNARADRLIDDFVAAVDLDAQRRLSRQIQELLLDETPSIIAYFLQGLSATRANVAGVQASATGSLDFATAGFTE